MKFEYTVKFNGKCYFPGEDVPMEPETVNTVEAKTVVLESIEEPTETIEVAEEADVKKSRGRKKK